MCACGGSCDHLLHPLRESAEFERLRGQGVEFSSDATTTEWGTSATVRLSLQDEVVEAPGVLHIVATKVLGELEAGVVFVAPVNGAGQSQRLVAIATRAQDFDHLKVGS